MSNDAEGVVPAKAGTLFASEKTRGIKGGGHAPKSVR